MRSPAVSFKSLSLNVFLLIVLFLLVPFYVSMIILKSSYEAYIQRELNSQVITAIQKGEGEFLDTFQKMVVISNVFALDRELLNLLRDEQSDYWDRNKRFDELVNNLLINNLFSLEGIKITMFDHLNRNYANWGLYFNDYSYILGEDWVKSGLVGQITWSLFTPSFVIGEDEQTISLARPILYPTYTGERIATIIISINEKFINALLRRNDMGADFIRVCTTDTLENIFAVNGVNFLRKEDLASLLEEAGKTETKSLLCEAEGRRYLLSYYTINSPWMTGNRRLEVLYFTDYQRITERLKTLSMTINFVMLPFLVILLGIVGIISGNIAKPIKLLSGRVSAYTKTQIITPFTIRRRDEIGELSRAFLDMEIRINDLFEKLREESEIREQYRFRALRAQINPHFLFNTLNTIRWMALIRRQDNIVDTINALSLILDYSMGRTGDSAALEEELRMIQSYVHIQNYRYGEDLEVSFDIEEGTANCAVIKFILQPAVENSYLHAFRRHRGKKNLVIAAKRDGQKLKLYVRDNGSGMNAETLNDLRKSLDQENNWETRSGIGLFNVHQRIRSGFGSEFGLHIESIEGEGTAVEYVLPLAEIPPEHRETAAAV